MTLPPQLLRARRRKGVLYPLFIREPLALLETLVKVYGEHVGRRRRELEETLRDYEGVGYDYRLVRGLAAVLEDRCVFEPRAAIPPREARRKAFEAAAQLGVYSEKDREKVLAAVAKELGVTPQDLEKSLYADLPSEAFLTRFNPPTAQELLQAYNFENGLGLLAHSREVWLKWEGPDSDIHGALRRVGAEKLELGSGKAHALFAPTRRVNQRALRLQEAFARLVELPVWGLEAVVGYPAGKGDSRLILDSGKHGGLMKPLTAPQEVLVVPEEPRGPPEYGWVVEPEELAQRLGVTVKKAVEALRAQGDYREVGGLMVDRGLHHRLKRRLSQMETLGEAQNYLRTLGVRNPLPVLEAYGIQVDWATPRGESRLYRLR